MPEGYDEFMLIDILRYRNVKLHLAQMQTSEPGSTMPRIRNPLQVAKTTSAFDDRQWMLSISISADELGKLLGLQSVKLSYPEIVPYTELGLCHLALTLISTHSLPLSR